MAAFTTRARVRRFGAAGSGIGCTVEAARRAVGGLRAAGLGFAASLLAAAPAFGRARRPPAREPLPAGFVPDVERGAGLAAAARAAGFFFRAAPGVWGLLLRAIPSV
jgi:hypothetical protein